MQGENLMSKLFNFALGFVATTALAFALFLGASGCGMFAEEVLVDEQYVLAAASPAPVPTQFEVLDPEGEPTGRFYVVTTKANVREGAPVLELDKAPDGSIGGSAGIAGPLGSLLGSTYAPFVPFAALIIGKLFSRRYRGHAVAAIKAAARLNLVEAGSRILKAEGAAHSTPASERAAEATDPAMHAKSAT